ncbi:hypothetical protein F5B18DRAFT_253904 [Nemania serpens]|nr:hypothetical protein F5B18DRAFT_253904 [Nemania serpens]
MPGSHWSNQASPQHLTTLPIDQRSAGQHRTRRYSTCCPRSPVYDTLRLQLGTGLFKAIVPHTETNLTGVYQTPCRATLGSMSAERIQNQNFAWSDTAANVPGPVYDNNESQSSDVSQNSAPPAPTQPTGSTISAPINSNYAENNVTYISLPSLTESVSLSTSHGTLVDGTAVRPQDGDAPNSHAVANSTTQDPSSASLVRFRSLPPGIRLMVWDAALSDGRALVLYAYPPAPELECTQDGSPGQRKIRGLVPLGPHVLCSVNIESRTEALTARPKREREDPTRWFALPRDDSFRWFTLPREDLARWVALPCEASLSPQALTWLDPTRDWVCVEPYNEILLGGVAYYPRTGFEYSIERLIETTQNLAIIKRFRMDSLQTIRWWASHVFKIGLSRQKQNLAIIYNVITLHSPARQTWAAGLIHHGDTHIVVDIADTVRLRHFYHFYITASRRRREKNVRLLEMLMLPEGRLQYEQYAVYEIKEQMLLALLDASPFDEREKFRLHQRPEPPIRAWWDGRDWVIGLGGPWPSPASQTTLVPGQNEYADGLLEQQFPEFRVMILFRICSAPVCDEEPEIND